MFCTRCGQSAMPGAAFCSRCGQPLPPAVPPQGYGTPPVPPVPPQEYAAPPVPPGVTRAKKRRTGMIIGIVAGITALIAIAAVLLFIWPGWLKENLSVSGTWYSEVRGEVISFAPNRGFFAQTPYGYFEGRYSLDAAAGAGRIRMDDGREFDFVLSRGRLLVDNIGVFYRAGDDFDAEGFLEEAG